MCFSGVLSGCVPLGSPKKSAFGWLGGVSKSQEGRVERGGRVRGWVSGWVGGAMGGKDAGGRG